MNELALAKRAFSATLRALRSAFPDDHDRRCLYAAAGLQRLLDQAGVDARIRGGDFLALVVSRSGDRASMQGFGKMEAEAGISHYWVETADLLLDVGPHLLPRGSSFPAAGIPLIAWWKRHDLPTALRYRARERYDRNTAMVLPGEVASRMEAFLDDVCRRSRGQVGQAALPSWLLTCGDELRRAAERDTWARGVLRFQREVDAATLPF